MNGLIISKRSSEKSVISYSGYLYMPLTIILFRLSNSISAPTISNLFGIVLHKISIDLNLKLLFI